MEPSKTCLDIVKHQEGLIPPKADGFFHAYHGKADKPGVWTIGYGVTWYPNGKSVREGDKGNETDIQMWLEWHVERVVDAINAHLPPNFSDQNQFDALVDFSYNLGTNALLTSTLWKKFVVNRFDISISTFSRTSNMGIPIVDSCEFLKWVRSNGEVVDDLVYRRATEAILYSTGKVDFLGH